MIKTVICAQCGGGCESLHWKMRIPSPKRQREWDEFWIQYLQEKKELERYYSSDRKDQEIVLPLLNMRLLTTPSNSIKKRPRASSRKYDH